MSRFKQIKNPAGNPELKAVYQKAVQQGFVGTEKDVPVNFMTAMGERPDILKATLKLTERILIRGILPPTVKQMIIVAVSIHNKCQYCTIAHTAALRALGVPREVVDGFTNNLDIAELTPPQRAIIGFALKTARDARSVTDGDYQSLRDFGLSDGEIMEVIMTAACANFFNTWADASGIIADGGRET